MVRVLFTTGDAWSGGSFELGINFHRGTNITTVIQQLWTMPNISGCYREPNIEPERQERVDPLSTDFNAEQLWRGVVTLPNKKEACCSLQVINGPNENEVWVYFGIPLGSLGSAYSIGAYPFKDDVSLGWVEEVAELLRELGQQVFDKVQFNFALVGWLDGADVIAEQLKTKGAPNQRWFGYLMPTEKGLQWLPANMGYPAEIDPK